MAAKDMSSPVESMDVDKEPETGSKPDSNDLHLTEESLLCTEEDLEPWKGGSDDRNGSFWEASMTRALTSEEAVVQAAEDAAMMRELARIIRRRALELKTRACKHIISP